MCECVHLCVCVCVCVRSSRAPLVHGAAAGRRHLRRQHLERRRLPGAVHAEQPKTLRGRRCG